MGGRQRVGIGTGCRVEEQGAIAAGRGAGQREAVGTGSSGHHQLAGIDLAGVAVVARQSVGQFTSAGYETFLGNKSCRLLHGGFRSAWQFTIPLRAFAFMHPPNRKSRTSIGKWNCTTATRNYLGDLSTVSPRLENFGSSSGELANVVPVSCGDRGYPVARPAGLLRAVQGSGPGRCGALRNAGAGR